MYRPVESGGLSVINVKNKAMAMLIHTFLAQAISPCFPTNLYHNSLYRWHVLEDRSITDPGKPPYYSSTFFSIIKDVHLNTALNVTWINVQQWYRILQEKGVTHTSDDLAVPPVLIASKLEEDHPEEDFQAPYALARQFGLSPDQKSFLFKLLQSLLPTRERLARLGKVQSPSCLFCEAEEDNTSHLLSCPQGLAVSAPLLRCLAVHVPNITPQNIILMTIPSTESMELPLIWLVSSCLMMIWEERQAGWVAYLVRCQAELQATCAQACKMEALYSSQ